MDGVIESDASDGDGIVAAVTAAGVDDGGGVAGICANVGFVSASMASIFSASSQNEVKGNVGVGAPSPAPFALSGNFVRA